MSRNLVGDELTLDIVELNGTTQTSRFDCFMGPHALIVHEIHIVQAPVPQSYGAQTGSKFGLLAIP